MQHPEEQLPCPEERIKGGSGQGGGYDVGGQVHIHLCAAASLRTPARLRAHRHASTEHAHASTTSCTGDSRKGFWGVGDVKGHLPGGIRQAVADLLHGGGSSSPLSRVGGRCARCVCLPPSSGKAWVRGAQPTVPCASGRTPCLFPRHNQPIAARLAGPQAHGLLQEAAHRSTRSHMLDSPIGPSSPPRSGAAACHTGAARSESGHTGQGSVRVTRATVHACF